MHPFVVPIICDAHVPDCAFLSSFQSDEVWYATVAVYGLAVDVVFVVLRAASHDALAGLHGAKGWYGGVWRSDAWHGVLDALPWSVSL